MYVNNNFCVLARDDINYFEELVFESLFLEIRTQSSDFRLVCGVIYRAPSGSRPKFCEQLETAVKKINGDNVTACLCGDFNFDLTENFEMSKNNFDLTENFKEYKKIMHQNNFFSCINRPTRFEKKETRNDEIHVSRTLIDHFWCNKVEQFSNSAILVDEFADHLAICCSIQTEQPHFSDTFVSFGPHLQNLSDAIKNSQLWKRVEHITTEDQRNQIQEIVEDIDKWFSKLDSKENEASSPNQEQKTAANEIKNLLTRLKDLRTKNAKYWLKIFVKILREAADKVQPQYLFRSSYKQTKEHSQFNGNLNQEENELNRITDKLVRIAQKHETPVQATENASLNREDRVAIPENIGDSLDLIQLLKSRAFFLTKTPEKYLSLLDQFGKCYSKNFSLFAQHLIPIDVVEKLPDNEVKQKLFSLLHIIYIHSFESVEQLFL